MKNYVAGSRDINELIARSNRLTIAPTSVRRPQLKQQPKPIVSRRGFELSAATVIGAVVGAIGHAYIIKKT
jgi:hypothetical protein